MRVGGIGTRGAAGALITLVLLLSGYIGICQPAEAKRHKSKHQSSAPASGGTKSRHHARHHTRSKQRSTTAAAKPRYAYPADIFMMKAPEQDLTLLAQDEGQKIRYAFQSGTAGSYAPNYLIKSGAVSYFPLRGGIFNRREKVKYIVVHSTETGVPQDAKHVVNSWSSGGLRHPGAQYIVDRDGTIFCTVDPTLATVHVNIFKTLPGINNDNSIGIEMCHTGSQNYPAEQRAAVIRLLTYLQAHYHVLNDNVITHRYAQQGDHTDPVNFDWEGFLASKDEFRNQALAMSAQEEPQSQDDAVIDRDVPPAAIYLEIHPAIKLEDVPSKRVATIGELQAKLGVTQRSITQSSATAAHAPLRGEIELPPGAATEFGAR